MAELIYAAITSLDGYVADEQGDFTWGEPDDEVHRFVNDLERPVGTYLYGRRLYEVMTGWETMDTEPGVTDVALDFARVWHAAEKIVYSRTLDEAAVTTARTRVEREFDLDAVRAMKAAAAADLSVGGAELAGQAIAAGLVDRYHFIVSPVVVGGGKPALPGGVRLGLELVELRRFGNGVVHLHYTPAGV